MKRLVIIHRIMVSQAGFEDTPDGIEKFFRDHVGWRPSSIPYHGYTLPDGSLEQRIPFSAVAHHATGTWNRHAIGWGVIGDWRSADPTDAAWDSTVDLAAALCTLFGWKPAGRVQNGSLSAFAVSGHDEVPSATAMPGKKCPGKNWHMPSFRRAVREKIPSNAGVVQLGALSIRL